MEIKANLSQRLVEVEAELGKKRHSSCEITDLFNPNYPGVFLKQFIREGA